MNKVNNFNTIKTSISLLENPNIVIPYPFTFGKVHRDISLIYYVVNLVLFKEKNSSQLNRSDVTPVWFLANIVENNWRKTKLLPYSRLVTKILEDSRFNLKEEEKIQNIETRE